MKSAKIKDDDIINLRIKVQSAIFELLEIMGENTPGTKEAVRLLALDILNRSLIDRIYVTIPDNTRVIDLNKEKAAL